jgi:hypothetical protein
MWLVSKFCRHVLTLMQPMSANEVGSVLDSCERPIPIKRSSAAGVSSSSSACSGAAGFSSIFEYCWDASISNEKLARLLP